MIRNNSGFVDKFIGDSIMALFPENTEDAINAAIEMRIKLTEFNHIISQFGQSPIDSGIGIHTGSLMLGIVGGEGRMEGTVISDAVNLASRLEGLTKTYGSSIIITEETLIKITDPTSCAIVSRTRSWMICTIVDAICKPVPIAPAHDPAACR